jgi:hypothetical protein
LRETIQTLQDNLERERKRTSDLVDEIELFKRRSKADDEVRDDRLQRLHKRDEELAERLDAINRPKTEAAAASTTATLLNAARKRETLEKLAYVLALILLAIWNLVSGKGPAAHSAPTVAVPIATTPPAGTGFAGRP